MAKHRTTVPPPSRIAPTATPPLRIFGAAGPAVTLGQSEYHLARLTTDGVLDVQEYLTRRYPVQGAIGDQGDSIGMQLVQGALFLGSFTPLRGLLERIIDEPLPPDAERAAAPDQIAAVIDRFFETSGLAWLARIVKNSTAQTSSVLDRAVGAAAQRMGALMAEELDGMIEELTPTTAGTASPSARST